MFYLENSENFIIPPLALKPVGIRMDDLDLRGVMIVTVLIMLFPAFALAQIDTTPPTISNVSVTNVSLTSATVTWATNEPADSKVAYGANQPFDRSTPLNTTRVTAHSRTLTGLFPSTSYSFSIKSRDAAGNTAVSTGTAFRTPVPNPAAPYNFSLGTYGPKHVTQGSSLYIDLTMALLGGARDYVYLSVAGIPPSSTHTFPDAVEYCCGVDQNGVGRLWSPQTTLLNIKTSSATPVGSYQIRITARSRGVTREATHTIYVDAVPTPLSQLAVTNIPPVPGLAQWESNMTSYGQLYCSQAQTGWEGEIWYYDGIRTYYQIADYTGQGSWNTCAGNVRAWYRDQYVLPNNGSIPGWRVFPHGLEKDYLRTGASSSRDAVNLLSTNSAFANLRGGVSHAFMRETAYIIQAYLAAERIGGPRNPKLERAVNFALGHIDQLFISQTGGDDRPFMDGLMMAALIEYYDMTKDPRIPPVVQKVADSLWANTWMPADKSFYYSSFTSPFPLPAPDLNLLIAPAYAWLWHLTADRKYQDRGDQIFAGGVEKAWFGNGKQFSQNYRWSFDYVKWRQNPPIVGLAAHFKFDETGGVTASDSSGNNNTAAVSGAQFTAGGKFGNTLSFDGVDDYARVATATKLNLSQALTIATWVKPKDLNGLYRTMAVKGEPGQRGFGMNIYNGKLNFVKLGVDDVASNVSLSTGTWEHVAITWNAATDEVKFYKDGLLVRTIIHALDVAAPLDADHLTIGSWPAGGSYFNGMIDDLRIYNRVLRAPEIQALSK